MNGLLVKMFLVGLFSLILVACGGGSGGSNTGGGDAGTNTNKNSAAPSKPQINYVGIMGAAPINENTSNDISEATQLAPSLILFAETLTIFIPTNAAAQKINQKFENDTVILTGEIFATSGSLTVEYKNYNKDGLTISGKQVQNYIRNGSDLMMSSFYFDNLEFISPTERNKFEGSIIWSSHDAPSKRLTLDCLVTDVNLNKSLYFKNISLDYKTRYSTTSVRSDDALSINGTVFISQLGSIKVSTSTPLSITESLETTVDFSAANGGMLKLEGNNSEAILYSISSSWFGFGIDTNNDQIVDVSRRYSWNSADPIAAQVQLDVEPIANSGRIDYWQVNKPFQLNSLFSHFNDKFLEHEWKLTYKPNKSEAIVQSANSPFQVFIPDVSVDYIFSVKITSNGKSSATTFVLRVYD